MHDISPKTQIACLRADIEEICRERDKAEAEAQALREEVAALRARVVVVPERCDLFEPISYIEGWNACLDEQARLNGKAVSEGLLRRILERLRKAQIFDLSSELSELLGEGKEP